MEFVRSHLDGWKENGLNWRIVAGGAVGGASVYLVYSQLFYETSWLRQTVDDLLNPWVKVGRVTDLVIYPVKSMHEVSVQQGQCTKWGLAAGDMIDRHFMMIDAKTNVFITSRTQPTMVLLQPSMQDGKLTIRNPQGSQMTIDVNKVVKNGNIRSTKHWGGARIDAFDCGDSIADWLQSSLKMDTPVRLVYYRPNLYNERVFWHQPKYAKCIFKVKSLNDKAAFSDMTPFMLTNEHALTDLNERLADGDKVRMNNMRGNIIIKADDTDPKAEDAWKKVKVGDCARFALIKPCTRCKLTTVDTETGIPNKNFEPVVTLRKYRMPTGIMREGCGEAPMFGIQLTLMAPGNVKVGDNVYAKQR